MLLVNIHRYHKKKKFARNAILYWWSPLARDIVNIPSKLSTFRLQKVEFARIMIEFRIDSIVSVIMFDTSNQCSLVVAATTGVRPPPLPPRAPRRPTPRNSRASSTNSVRYKQFIKPTRHQTCVTLGALTDVPIIRPNLTDRHTTSRTLYE